MEYGNETQYSTKKRNPAWNYYSEQEQELKSVVAIKSTMYIDIHVHILLSPRAQYNTRSASSSTSLVYSRRAGDELVFSLPIRPRVRFLIRKKRKIVIHPVLLQQREFGGFA